ncbi:MAG: DUF3316 domain-containing protein [Psychromonas sp.]
MNMIKKAFLASTMILLSAQVFASDTRMTSRVLPTADATSQAAAYELALTKLETLKADTPVQLNKDLGHLTSFANTVTLNDGSYTTVQEKMDANGNIMYTGLVHVSATFSDN